MRSFRRRRSPFGRTPCRKSTGDSPRVEPALGGAALAVGTLPVKVGVVGDLVDTAPGSAQDVAAQRRAAALFDGRHDLELSQGQVAALGLTPGWTMIAVDVGDLQGRPPQGGSLATRAALPPCDQSPRAAGRRSKKWPRLRLHAPWLMAMEQVRAEPEPAWLSGLDA